MSNIIKKIQKKEQKQHMTNKEKFMDNFLRARRAIAKRQLEVEGAVLKRLADNTLWVLRDTFKFSRKMFDKFNAGIMHMSAVCKLDRTLTTRDFQITLKEECKFIYKERQKIEISYDHVAEEKDPKKRKELLTYSRMFNTLVNNKAIEINTQWEGMILWVLHEFMGFGKVRLERFQNEMRKLWSIEHDEIANKLRIVKEAVGLDRIGTGTVYLQKRFTN